MKSIIPFLLVMTLLLGCVHDRCGLVLSGLEVGVFGSESNGTSQSNPTGGKYRSSERWKNDDSTIGGHATVHMAFVGLCAGYEPDAP